jgi:hypothetical protein
MSDSELESNEDLLIEKLAELLRFDKLSGMLPIRDIYPPYLLLAFSIFIDFGVVHTYRYFFTPYQHVLIKNPILAVGPLALGLAAVGIRYMSNGYLQAVEGLNLNRRSTESSQDRFKRVFPIKLKLIVHGMFTLSLYAVYVFGVGVNTILEHASLIEFVVNHVFIIGVIYVPFVVEFGLIYFSIHFSIPRRIRRSNIGLFYYDPRNMGGFAPVGQLLKRTYYLYTTGLILFFIFIYGPHILPIVDPTFELGIVPLLFFTSAWMVGIVSIGYSMITMHRIMSTKKEERIQELEKEIEELIENPYDINSSEVKDKEKLEDLNRRLEKVKQTRVYPATFTMWSQIVISVLLPQGLQLVTQITL